MLIRTTLPALFLLAARWMVAADTFWLPTRVGDRWIYAEELLSGNRKHPDISRWQIEQTTFSTERIATGLLVKRRVRLLNHTAPPSQIQIRPESDILIRDHCAYFLQDSPSGGGTLPDACFPMQIGQTWGNPNEGRDLWTVAGHGSRPGCWRLEAHLSSGDDNYVWFTKGIGITAARTYHNGTYNDQRLRLVSFRPGKPKR